jgi:hypothetical protein
LSNLQREFLERRLSGGIDLDHGSAELTHHPAEDVVLPILDLTQGLHSNWLIAHECFTLLEINPLLGGQTELPNGCGRLALRAYEEKRWRTAGHCRCPRRMAGDLLSSGRGQLDHYDRDYAL